MSEGTRRRNTGVLAAHFTRNQILESASLVFAERGLRDTSVADLLEAASVSRRTFYKYFSNKEEVLASLYELATELLQQTIRTAVASASELTEQIERAVEAYLVLHSTAGPLFRVLQEEAIRARSPLSKRRERMHLALVQWLDELVTSAHGTRIDPWVFRTILWQLEALSRHLLSATSVSSQDVERAKSVMFAVVGRVLRRDGDPEIPLPNARK